LRGPPFLADHIFLRQEIAKRVKPKQYKKVCRQQLTLLATLLLCVWYFRLSKTAGRI